MPEIIYRKLKDLKLLGNNPRQIGKPEFETLCKSLISNPDYFEARPLILSDRTGEFVIIAGNMRYRAAKHNKQKEVPTILLSGLTEEREAEIIIRDNVNNGAWDFDLVANEWSDYPLADWGLDVPDFEAVEEVGTGDAEPQIDKAAELNKKWGVVSGDLWQIGEHRLLCGDSTKQHLLLSNGICVTSPPYNAGKTATELKAGKSSKYEDDSDDLTQGDYACQNLNRKCYAIEISENYCAVILERMATAFPDIEIKKLDG